MNFWTEMILWGSSRAENVEYIRVLVKQYLVEDMRVTKGDISSNLYKVYK